MQITLREDGGVQVWISHAETYDWARRPNDRWPCSTLSGKRVFAEFAANGDLVDYSVNGKHGEHVCDDVEFNAITSYFIRAKYPEHPAVHS